jgi:hypothetical protein
MSLAESYLSLTRELLLLRSDAGLRRTVSTAYYALFHLLVEAAAERIATSAGLEARLLMRRFQHQTMNEVCGALKTQKKWPEGILTAAPSKEILELAEIFVRLQEERERADYERGFSFPHRTVQQHVEDLTRAFSLWDSTKQTAEGHTFLMLLLLGWRWNKPR